MKMKSLAKKYYSDVANLMMNKYRKFHGVFLSLFCLFYVYDSCIAYLPFLYDCEKEKREID